MGMQRIKPACPFEPAALSLAPTLLLVALSTGAQESTYRGDVEGWRKGREMALKADGGWLTVAGLFWLKDGANRFGSGPENEIVLPGSAPKLAGHFVPQGNEVRVRFEPSVEATVQGQPTKDALLHSDTSGTAEVVAFGPLRMHVIERGGRLAIRLKDMNAETRRAFTGLHWFPVDERYRVTARFVHYRERKPLSVPNILGQVEKMPSPGYAVFELGGQEQRLEGVLESPDSTQLFFIFKDATSGKETYPSGRFLYSELPKEGKLVLDFNKAYNPPCAFTAYATCPLPPKENWLAERVEAGELRYGH
jgi:uncharacterized protein (DUF1684 family)